MQRMSLHVSVSQPRKKRGEKSLYVRTIARVNGKVTETRTSTNTMDMAEAEAQAAAHRADVEAGRPLGAGLTVVGVLEAKAATVTKPSSIKNHANARLALLEGPLGLTPASMFKREGLILARDKMLEGRAASTVNLYVRLLASAWRWARERGLVSVEWPSLKRLKEKRTNKRPYTDAEVRDVLAFMAEHRPTWLPLFSALADTGCRIGELLGLRGEDVLRRGGATLLHFVRTKTDEERTIPLPAETAALLPKASAEALVFHKKGKPLTDSAVRHVLYDALEKLGVQDRRRLDLHSFRRAWVSTATAQGATPLIAMRVTGHEDISVFRGYQRNATHDLTGVVQRVHDARRPSHGQAQSSQPPTIEALGRLDMRDSRGYSSERYGSAPAEVAPGLAGGMREELHRAVLDRVAVHGRKPDADLALSCRWGDESPRTLWRLVEHATDGLGLEIRTALLALFPEFDGAGVRSEERRA